MGVDFAHDEAKKVHARLTILPEMQGPPGFSHGGVIAAVLDEIMSCASWISGNLAFAAHLELDYRRPVPIGTELRFEGWVDGVDGRKTRTVGRALFADGTVATEATGLFIAMKRDG